MGNAPSADSRHIRIWQNLTTMHSDETRIQMLETLMAGAEFVNAAKRAGVYAFVLQWIAAYRRGEHPEWPGAPKPAPKPVATNRSYGSPEPRAGYGGPEPVRAIPRGPERSTTLATVPPPKRALDTLHESYYILGIDDTKPLTMEGLRLAYKKAAAKAHPDRGGTAEAFDNVTRAFLYLEEILKKLLPRKEDEVRLTQPVTKEAALRARELPLSKFDAERGRLEEPKVALNPKNLNLDVFNKLFEENRLPDPEQDGYGDWLKSNGEDRRLQNESQLRSKFNADVFNRTFVEQGRSESALQKYQVPDAITHHGGVELGAGRPQHYISPMGAKTKYTDLKFAYGEGSTFSQEVAGISEGHRTFDAMKRERESAPVPLTSDEQRVLEAMERQKKAAEDERLRRLAVHDVAAEDTYTKLKQRLMIH